ALGESLPDYGPAASRTFSELSQQKDFRTRYLLLGPAASLAATDKAAHGYVSRALTSDPNAHIRLGAAVAAQTTPVFTRELLAAFADRSVRVRRAAVEGMGHKRDAKAEAPLVERLQHDGWPMVRAAAAGALGGLGPSASADAAL